MDNIDKLRKRMQEENIDGVIIPTGDYHQSEYSCDYFRLVRFFSEFSGSQGTVVVLKDKAALFTDGRYFVQAENELDSEVFELCKMGVKGVPTLEEYIAQNIKAGVVAFDGKLVSAQFGKKIRNKLPEQIEIKVDFDATEGIWEERPQLPKDKAFVLEECYAGESVKSKIARVRKAMRELAVDTHIISSLDDIAWLLNIRGNDIAYTPVVMSYLILTGERIDYYVDKSKLSDIDITYFLDNDINVYDYEAFYERVDAIRNSKVLLDEKRVNCYINESVAKKNQCVYRENPTVLFKAVKNDVEIENIKKAHIKDGVAVTKFMIWLKENVGRLEITEYDAAQYLKELRMKGEGFIEESFNTISAYKENAAMMHYACDRKNAKRLECSGMLLVDSGGHYYEGTTDVTRTFALGPVSDEEKKAFTLTLKGMMNLTNAKFLHGCIGLNLDILARGPLWSEGLDYRCGTGHGVSYLAGVHEAPNGFRWKHVPEREDGCVLEAGMVTTNEPGVYVEGKYGIRIENELLCVKDVENEYGQFMKFETLTLVPIDTDLIDTRYLNSIEIERVNEYNQRVFGILLQYFDEKEAFWLQKNVKILH